MAKKPMGSSLHRGNGNTKPGKLNMTGLIDKDALSLEDAMTGNVYYQPPYSEVETNAASCQELNDMITKVAWEIGYGDSLVASGQRQAWLSWLQNAQVRYANNCEEQQPIKIIKGATFDPVPVDILSDTPLDTGMVDDPNIIRHPPILPVMEIGDEPSVDHPELIKTLNPPVISPIPVLSGGGGGGGVTSKTGNAALDNAINKRNWTIPVALAVVTAGYFLFSPKMKMV